MQVTYLGHSGFLAETDQAYYLFDYIRGALPDFSGEKPLLVFASHFHADHFDPVIFHEKLSSRVSCYYLSSDILRKYRKKAPDWLNRYPSLIRWVDANTSYPLPSGTLSTLRSTDEGVAFAVCEENGKSLYHAGDLNWWHWEGEAKAWNRNMEVNYKREIDKLNGQSFDAAFVPVDPRLESAYWYGLHYFLKQTHTSHVFPMHFWEKYEIIPKYLREHPAEEKMITEIHLIHKEEEQYEI